MNRRKDPTKMQETRDALCISTWKSSLKGYNSTTCSQELCDYLDEKMPGWRVDHHVSKPRSVKLQEKADNNSARDDDVVANMTTSVHKLVNRMMPVAEEIVGRFLANGKQYPSLKFDCRTDPSRSQEYADAKKLNHWKSHVDERQASTVFSYLDEHMPNWRVYNYMTTTVKKRKDAPISKAREIFRRCGMRGGALPRFIDRDDQTTPELMLEHTDALKLRDWKQSLESNPHKFCPVLKKFLNSKLKQWLETDNTLLENGLPNTKVEKPTGDDSNVTSSPNKRKQLAITDSDHDNIDDNDDDTLSLFDNNDESGGGETCGVLLSKRFKASTAYFPSNEAQSIISDGKNILSQQHHQVGFFSAGAPTRSTSHYYNIVDYPIQYILGRGYSTYGHGTKSKK